MAERRRGGAGFLWFTVGFLSGVLVALAGMLALDGGGRMQAEQAQAAEPEPPPVRHVRRLRPAPEPPPEPAAAVAAAPAPAVDEQVVEDAAAAGMTSRTERDRSQP